MKADSTLNRGISGWRFSCPVAVTMVLVLAGLLSSASGETVSIWPPSAVPTNPSAADTDAVTVGLKFQSASDGYLTGIRFYKGPTNSGTHVGSIWTAGGSQLAGVVFSNETASGWQEQPLGAPLPIAADTTYVVAYHSPTGGYAVDIGYFTGGGVTNDPLRALADGQEGGNGVYAYGPAGTFPNATFGAANYWVDVVYSADLGPDTNPPVVVAVSPADGETDVSDETLVTVTFNEGMDSGTVNTGTFLLLNPVSNPVAATVSYDGGSFTATLTPDSALTHGETYTATVLSGAGGMKDQAGNPLTGDHTWTFTIEPPDLTPPEVASVSPTNGATGVGVSAVIRVIFSEAMDAGSINAGTILLRDALSNTVSASVAYDGGSFIATLTPHSPLNLSAAYSAIVVSGAGGAKDLAGIPLGTDFEWMFTVTDEPTISIWNDAALPAVPSAGDTSAVELGVKFESAVAGYITGIRFYKGPTNTGTHAGNLWTLGGSNLASVVFVDESDTGWQQELLPAPVPVLPDTTYVASYHAPNGGYAVDVGYFSGGGVTNHPLRALGGDEAGGNGVFGVGPAGTFPASTFNAANYWVDVVFQETLGPDTNAPSVLAVHPMPDATLVDTGTTVEVTFSEAMDAGTINTGTISMLDPLGVPVGSTVSYDAVARTATLTPDTPLAYTTMYTAIVSGGTNGVTDGAGNAMEGDMAWSFVTRDLAARSLWDDGTTPASGSSSDTNSIELGMKFQTDLDGYINGIRFFKGAANTGEHVGTVWTLGGSNLAQVVFSNETASGWQEQPLDEELAIVPGATYVVSYHAPNGGYSADVEYFAAGGETNYPLRALADGEEGGNGVYVYSTESAFPSNTFNAANYWVDVAYVRSVSNTPPILPAQPNRTVAELTSVLVTNRAADLGVPVQTLAYQLLEAPGNAGIGADGVIAWTPSEAQGPGSYLFTTAVSDDGDPILSATNSFTITVTEVNVPPVFTATPADRGVPELALMTVANGASDVDLPADVLTYVLLSAPAGAQIDSQGVITWTPTEAQGPSVNTIVSEVSDGEAAATNSFVVTVNEVNAAPAAQNQLVTLLEDTATNLVLTGSDGDLPASALTYAVLASAPDGTLSDFDPATGAVTYTPNADYTGTDVFTFTVSDGLLLATGSVDITLTAVDDPPRAEDQEIVLLEDASTNLLLTASDVDTTYLLTEVVPVAAVSTPDDWALIAGASKVAAVAANDGSGSYIASGSTANNVQQFALADPATVRPHDTISSIRLRATCRRSTNANIHYRVGVVLGPSVQEGPEHGSSKNSYTQTSDTFSSRPGGGAWTLPDVMDLEARIRNIEARSLLCTKFDAVVDYENSLGTADVLFSILEPPVHGTLGPLDPYSGETRYTPHMDYAGPDAFAFTASIDGLLSTGKVSIFVTLVDAPHAILDIGVTDQVATVTWSSVPGETYVLEYAEEPAMTNWVQPLPRALAGETVSSMTNATGASSNRWYRVLRLP